MTTPTAPRRALLGLICLAFLPGCRQAQPPSATPPTPKAPRAADAGKAEKGTRSFRLVGVVVGADPKAGEVRIKHEAIPGYMAAMTMDFTVKDKETLDDLRPGDEVEGTLRVGAEDSELVDLVVTRPAPAAPLTLDLSGGTVTLKPTPAVLKPGEEVPNFTLTTQDGQALCLSDLRGKVVALTFIYTRCPLPDFCPAVDRKFAELASKVSAVPARVEAVRLLSVSFDPEHDTPEVLAQHARRQGAIEPLWTFAVASHDELAKVAAPLGLSYGPTGREIAHTLSTALIDPEGRLVRLDAGAAGKSWTPAEYAQAIAALLAQRR